MDIDRLRKLLLSLPGATEQVQWEDALVFKVGGRMFAVGRLEPGETCLSFKCSEEDFAELIERPGVIPAPYLARAHWVAMESETAIPRTELDVLLRRAHAAIVEKLPKKIQAKVAEAKAGGKKRKKK